MRTLRIFGAALAAWWNDNALRLGASVAFYTLFAIAPVLIVAIAIAGTIFGADAARGEIVGQIDGLVGTEGGKAVQALLQGASRRQDKHLAAVVGGVTFVLAACGAFLELQAAFNAIWRVAPVSRRTTERVPGRPAPVLRPGGRHRLPADGVARRQRRDWRRLAAGWAGGLPAGPCSCRPSTSVLSMAVTTTLFALLFKFLPDVVLAWRDVLTGALVTAVLFAIGKEVIGLYLGQGSTASSYGAAGSVVVLLLWVYYSSQIVLVGAEFTRLHADREVGRVPTESFAEAVGAPPGSVEAREPVA